MKFDIRTIGFTLTPAIEQYAEKRLGKLETFFSKPENLHVAVKCTQIRDQFRVEVSLTKDELNMRAEEKGRDLYEGIDQVEKKMIRQIHKYKTKMNRHVRNEFPVLQDFTEDLVAREDSFEIVRRKAFSTKPMTPEEAILEMNLLDHTFFVFQDAETGETQVVYKRRDGKYGLITTEFPVPTRLKAF